MTRFMVYRWADVLKFIGLALTYALSIFIVLTYLTTSVKGISILWIPGGIGLASLLIGGKKYWISLFLGSLLIRFFLNYSVLSSVLGALSNSIEPVVGVWLLERISQQKRCQLLSFELTLTHLKDYLSLAFVASMAAISAALMGYLPLLTQLTVSEWLIGVLYWWMGNSLGMILITPLILVWQQAFSQDLKHRSTVETVLCFSVCFFVGCIVFWGWLPSLFGSFAKGFLLFVFVVWAAIRFERTKTLLLITIIAIQGLVGLIHGVGYFSGNTPQINITNFWLFMLELVSVGISLALIVNERKQIEKKLREREVELQGILDNAPIGIWLTGVDGRYRFVNKTFCDAVDIPEDDFLRTQNLVELVGEVIATSCLKSDAECLAQEKPHISEELIPFVDGKQHFLEVTKVKLHDDLGVVTGIIGIGIDMTERKLAEEELKLAALVYHSSSEAMMVTDANNKIISVNPAFIKMTGYTAHDILGRTPKTLSSGLHDQTFYRMMREELNFSGHWQGEIWNRRKNGEFYPEWLSINTIFNSNGSVHQRVALFSDITQKKEAEQKIWKQANFDSLTELPNRQQFHDRLAQGMKKTHEAGLSLALLFIDLDRFKEVNDTLGHNIGDLLLKEVALRLNSCIRQSDTLARLGGDEFTIILAELTNLKPIEKIAHAILKKLLIPFQLEDEIAYISASIGIAIYPGDGGEMDELIKSADQAMYASKNQGRNRYNYFTSAMQEEAQKRRRLTNDLRMAIAEIDQQLNVFYQPIVELATGVISKAEALIRWQHPSQGFISPADFIPIAEETGMIIEIGDWVFKRAARQVANWRTKYHPAFQISINKSPVQFHHEMTKHKAWIKYLEELQLSGQSIVVEITESLLMVVSDALTAQLLEFRDAGVQVSIDDFGTGYSSLSYLKKFDIDYLKIDQSFVRNLVADSDDFALCEAIIVMAHKLGIKVIAEGIETAEQCQLLTDAGCDYGQGYFFSKPLVAQEFEKLLVLNQA